MNALASRPVPDVSPRLEALMRENLAELRKTQQLVRRAIAERGELIELTAAAARLADMAAGIRDAATATAIGRLAAAPEPGAQVKPSRTRRRVPAQVRGQLPLLAVVRPATS